MAIRLASRSLCQTKCAAQSKASSARAPSSQRRDRRAASRAAASGESGVGSVRNPSATAKATCTGSWISRS